MLFISRTVSVNCMQQGSLRLQSKWVITMNATDESTLIVPMNF